MRKVSLLFGSRTGFGLEFHVGHDPRLLCVDIFVGGLHVNTWDNAFYPPLLVKKLKDELSRFRTPTAPPTGLVSPLEAFRLAEDSMRDDAGTGTASEAGSELWRYRFLDWGECTDGVLAFAFPDGDRVHLVCRVREGGGPAWGTEARHEPTVLSVNRTALVETLEHSLTVAGDRGDTRYGGDVSRCPCRLCW